MPKVTYTCPNCKEEFQDWRHRERNGKVKPHCSIKCERATRHAGWRNKLRQEREAYKAGKPISFAPRLLKHYLIQAGIICRV
jgi:hypothetical protein